MEAIAHLNKLEDELGLRNERKKKEVFKNDMHIFEGYFKSPKHKIKINDPKSGERSEIEIDIDEETDFVKKKKIRR